MWSIKSDRFIKSSRKYVIASLSLESDAATLYRKVLTRAMPKCGRQIRRRVQGQGHAESDQFRKLIEEFATEHGQGGCAVAADKQAPIAAVMAKKTQLLWGL